jgi:tetratricopeptide (TPR) repeat protein
LKGLNCEKWVSKKGKDSKVKKIHWSFLGMICISSLIAQTKVDSLKTVIKNEPNNIQALIALGVHYHDLGVAGDHKAVERGEELLQKALSLDPNNAYAMGYYGSILSLKARDASMPWTKVKYAKQGFEQLDKSIQLNPDDLDVRLIRAMNSYQVPKFMKRLPLSLEDFDFIIKHSKFESWTPDHRAFVYLHFGKALEKDEQPEKAKEFFELAMKEAPGSKAAQEAKKAIKK